MIPTPEMIKAALTVTKNQIIAGDPRILVERMLKAALAKMWKPMEKAPETGGQIIARLKNGHVVVVAKEDGKPWYDSHSDIEWSSDLSAFIPLSIFKENAP